MKQFVLKRFLVMMPGFDLEWITSGAAFVQSVDAVEDFRLYCLFFCDVIPNRLPPGGDAKCYVGSLLSVNSLGKSYLKRDILNRSL